MSERLVFVRDRAWSKHPAEMTVTVFAGGREDGACLQFDIDGRYIQLTRGQVAFLSRHLDGWMLPNGVPEPPPG